MPRFLPQKPGDLSGNVLESLGHVYYTGVMKEKSLNDPIVALWPEEVRAKRLAKFRQVGGCLVRPGLEDKYALFRHNYERVPAHRASLMWATGVVPGPETVTRHKCRNRGCIAPAHLQFGTFADNAADKKRDGTDSSPSHRAEEHENAKITSADAIAIYKAYLETDVCRADLAQTYNVSEACIAAIVKKTAWKQATKSLPAVTRQIIKRKIRAGSASGMSKLKESDIPKIRTLLAAKQSQASIGRLFKVHAETIGDINRGRTWMHVR